MTEGEKVHYLTENVYKNLIDNFNPGVKQLISSGRNLAKALHNVTLAAKTYIECVYNIAQGAQLCKGATSEIGAALLQIAEVQKEINTQVSDNVKSLHAEFLIPVETKQDSEGKQIQLIHKKYLAGHKYHAQPLDKAASALKKHKKKSKAAKYGYDQKEIQYSRDVKDHQMKLDDYRLQGLRQALGEERKRYAFVLDRICAMVRNYASHHSKAHELLTHRLPEWSDLTRNPQTLPESSENLIRQFRGLVARPIANDPPPDGAPRRMDSLHREPLDNYIQSQGLVYAHEQQMAVEQAHQRHMAAAAQVLDMPAPHRPQVQALYAHEGPGDTQLSFIEGDVIALIGDKRDGWQYGENLRSHRMGWFPVAFTMPVDHRIHTRARSFGNLNDFMQQREMRHERSHTFSHDRSSLPIDQRSPIHSLPDYGRPRQPLMRTRPASMYAISHNTLPPTPEHEMPDDTQLTREERTVTWAAGLNHRDLVAPLPLPPHVTNSPAKSKVSSTSVPEINGLTDVYGVVHRAPAPPTAVPPPPPPPPPQRTVSGTGVSQSHARPALAQRNSAPLPDSQPPLPPRSMVQQIPEKQEPREEHTNPGGDIYDSRGHALSEPAYMSRRDLQTQMMLAAGQGEPPLPSTSNSSSGYSGSNNHALPHNHVTSHVTNPLYANHTQILAGGHSGPQSPGFPPPPPPLAVAPTPPSTTSDYEEEPPVSRYRVPRGQQQYFPIQ